MTLIVALKFADGTVLASDRRTMIGDLKRDGEAKIESLTSDIGITAAGLVGATDDILCTVKAFCRSSSPVSFDGVVSSLSDATLDWHKKNSEKLDESDEGEVSIFLVASPDRIRRVLEKGYSEEVHDYDCGGAGSPYAEYILGNFYRANLKEEEAKELAVYAILETSKMDPSVGDDIDLLVARRETGCEIVSRDEAIDIKLRLAPVSKTVVEEQIGTVERIVNLRDDINALFEAEFKFKLFYPSERAVLQLMKPCRSEGEFTNSIAALALLIDQLNVKEMKKAVPGKEGSINILQQFASERIGDFPTEIIQTFRDVMTMRSKKFPIHATNSRFVDVVVRVVGTYPPNWSDLYLKSLSLYERSLKELLDYLKKADKLKEQTP